MDNVTSNQVVNDEDSPFTFNQRTSLKADDRQLEFSHGCGTSINPYYDNPEKHLELPDSIIEMYKLGGSDCGWVLKRDLHLWNGDPITDPKKIEIRLSNDVTDELTRDGRFYKEFDGEELLKVVPPFKKLFYKKILTEFRLL